MLKKIIHEIQPANQERKSAALNRWNQLAKPPRGLGLLEDAVITLAGIFTDISIQNKAVAVMCGDNGVNEEKVSTLGSPVTAMVAENMLCGKASVALMARQVNARILVVDVGMNSDVPGTLRLKTRYGTENILHSPAMAREDAIAAVEAGIAAARLLKEEGTDIIASGEMGIGNTTTSSAVAAVLLGRPPADVTGRGAGISSERTQRKAAIIEQAIANHKPDAADPLDVLAKVGGLDLAAMTGLFLGGARYGVPVIIDGFISSASALLAARLCPAARDYMLPSHLSKEPGAAMILEALSLKPIIHSEMALGEGTGAVALLPLLEMALEVYQGMPLYSETTILDHAL